MKSIVIYLHRPIDLYRVLGGAVPLPLPGESPREAQRALPAMLRQRTSLSRQHGVRGATAVRSGRGLGVRVCYTVSDVFVRGLPALHNALYPPCGTGTIIIMLKW